MIINGKHLIWLGFNGYFTTGVHHKKKVKLMSGNFKINKVNTQLIAPVYLILTPASVRDTIRYQQGRAVAQAAVSYQLPTATAWVQSQVVMWDLW
jgi:hypothetical protein